MLARKEVMAAVATTEDRLSRNAPYTLMIYEQWTEERIELYYCDRGKVNFDDESILVNGVPVLVAHYERVRTRKRTTKGRYDKARDGKPVMNGGPGYFRVVYEGQQLGNSDESASNREKIEQTRNPSYHP